MLHAAEARILINLCDKDGIKLDSIIIIGCPIIAHVSAMGYIVEVNKNAEFN